MGKKDFKLVTLSIGVAQLIERETLEKSISDLINRADKAMYEAKKNEKDNWVVDEESIKQFSNEESPNGDEPSQPLL